MRRKGPNGYVTEACGKRNVKELPDGIQVCLGCFNKAQRHAEVEAKADKIRAKVEAQVISIRSRGVEAAIQENNGFPTGIHCRRPDSASQGVQQAPGGCRQSSPGGNSSPEG
jgi:hypothetical protein